MKIIYLLLLIVLLSLSQDEIASGIINLSQKIRTELLNSKSLPQSIHKSNWTGTHAHGQYDYIYYTTRKENNIVDSIIIVVEILDNGDSLGNLLFHEMCLKDLNTIYDYRVNKKGVIDWAYSNVTIAKEPTDVEGFHRHPPITIEINTDSTNSFYPLKKPDQKTIAKYNARLKTTLEELNNILFK